MLSTAKRSMRGFGSSHRSTVTKMALGTCHRKGPERDDMGWGGGVLGEAGGQGAGAAEAGPVRPSGRRGLGRVEPAGGRSDLLAADGLSQLPREDESVAGAVGWACSAHWREGRVLPGHLARAAGKGKRGGHTAGPRVGIKVKSRCQCTPNTMTGKSQGRMRSVESECRVQRSWGSDRSCSLEEAGRKPGAQHPSTTLRTAGGDAGDVTSVLWLEGLGAQIGPLLCRGQAWSPTGVPAAPPQGNQQPGLKPWGLVAFAEVKQAQEQESTSADRCQPWGRWRARHQHEWERRGSSQLAGPADRRPRGILAWVPVPTGVAGGRICVPAESRLRK